MTVIWMHNAPATNELFLRFEVVRSSLLQVLVDTLAPYVLLGDEFASMPCSAFEFAFAYQ